MGWIKQIKNEDTIWKLGAGMVMARFSYMIAPVVLNTSQFYIKLRWEYNRNHHRLAGPAIFTLGFRDVQQFAQTVDTIEKTDSPIKLDDLFCSISATLKRTKWMVDGRNIEPLQDLYRPNLTSDILLTKIIEYPDFATEIFKIATRLSLVDDRLRKIYKAIFLSNNLS